MMKMATLNSGTVNPFIDPINSFGDDNGKKTSSPKFNSKGNDEDSDPEVAAETTTGHNVSKTQGAIKSFAPGKSEIRLLPPAPGSGKSKQNIESSDFSFKSMRSTVGKPMSQFKADLLLEAADNEETKDPDSLRPDMKRKTISITNIRQENSDECLKAISPQENNNS